LHLGRGPVDLIRQDKTAEDGPAFGLEFTGPLVIDERAGNIGREQIRCELDAPNDASNTWARVLTIKVLARPGTPSSSTWPFTRMPISSLRITASCPTITLAISVLTSSRMPELSSTRLWISSIIINNPLWFRVPKASADMKIGNGAETRPFPISK